jgi:uncharacterized protein YjbJ (UPF0337 family)
LVVALADALRVYSVDVRTQRSEAVLGANERQAIAKGKVEMNVDQLEGKWKQITGQVRQKWGHLTDSDITVIAGKRDVLIGRVQERYGLAKEKAAAEVDGFLKTLHDQPEQDTQNTSGEERNERPERTKAHTAGQR